MYKYNHIYKEKTTQLCYYLQARKSASHCYTLCYIVYELSVHISLIWKIRGFDYEHHFSKHWNPFP